MVWTIFIVLVIGAALFVIVDGVVAKRADDSPAAEERPEAIEIDLTKRYVAYLD